MKAIRTVGGEVRRTERPRDPRGRSGSGDATHHASVPRDGGFSPGERRSGTATRNDGTTHEDTVLLILTQKDGKITGSIGGGENDQHPIATGTIDGDKVVITATHATNGREYRLELTLQNEELNGTVTAGEMRAQVRTKRRKENPK